MKIALKVGIHIYPEVFIFMSIYIYVVSTGVVIVVMNVAPHVDRSVWTFGKIIKQNVFCVNLHIYIFLSINIEMIILQLYTVILKTGWSFLGESRAIVLTSHRSDEIVGSAIYKSIFIIINEYLLCV